MDEHFDRQSIYILFIQIINRYFCESQWCPCLQSRSLLGTRMRVSVLHSRAVGHPICDLGRIIATRQLDALTVLWTHYVLIIVFTSSPTCFAGKKSIVIRLITMKDRFFSAPARIRHFVLWSGGCAMTVAFHVLQKICRIRYSSQVTDLTVALSVTSDSRSGNELVLELPHILSSMWGDLKDEWS